MRGLGTIINMACIVISGIAGMLLGKYFKERMRETVNIAAGTAIMFMGAGETFRRMLTVTEGGTLSSSGTIMMICSLVIGAIIGEFFDLDGKIYRFGMWLKRKSGSEGDSTFVSGFVNASCTVCIGAMAIMGAIQDGISGDYSILMAKGLLDAIIIFIMASAQGKGTIFSAIPVGILQGLITVMAAIAGSFLPETSISALSYVGNILIFLVGINLAFEKNIRVANILPAVVVAAIWGGVM